jgi:catechol 2,3-dioxygenase-like lactoylglutathione lyase family enzyme
MSVEQSCSDPSLGDRGPGDPAPYPDVGWRKPITITLNHTIIPARDKEAAARFFAEIFGLRFEGSGGHFAPVRVNDTLTLDFADAKGTIASQHYAFHVSDAEFDAILQRVNDAGLAFGSGPWSLEDGKLNDLNDRRCLCPGLERTHGRKPRRTIGSLAYSNLASYLQGNSHADRTYTIRIGRIIKRLSGAALSILERAYLPRSTSDPNNIAP